MNANVQTHVGKVGPILPPLFSHQPALVWLTGLSGSGKSTLAIGLKRRLNETGVLAAIVDGDCLRAGLNAGLGFSPEDRKENVRRAGEVALLLAENGLVVIAALITPFRADRTRIASRAKERALAFAEVYVNASIEECERRDPKSLYSKARAGVIPNFTGIDSPYEPPLAPALEIRTGEASPDESIEMLLGFVLRLINQCSKSGFQPHPLRFDRSSSELTPTP